MNLLKNGLFNTLLASSPLREKQQKTIRKELNTKSSKRIFTSSNSQSIEIFETDLHKKKVIFFPGWLGHKDSKYLIPLAHLLHTNKYKDNEIHLVGFSLGGNVSLRISASDSIDFLKSTVVLSPVIDPQISMQTMDNASWILKKYFINKWHKSLKRKIEFHTITNLEKALKCKNLMEMTEFFTKNFSPHESIEELFYGYAITQNTLNQIKHKTLIYSSIDDPCIPIEPLLKLNQTDFVKFKPQKYGGHCGFIDDFKFSSSVYDEIVSKLDKNRI
jgi:predicted alpha/beta-fold hydrolase